MLFGDSNAFVTTTEVHESKDAILDAYLIVRWLNNQNNYFKNN